MELLEIGLLGTPVASLITPGLQEHGFTDGQDLLAIDPSDPAGSARKIADLASSPMRRSELAATLRRKVLRDFSLEHAMDRVLEKVNPASKKGAEKSETLDIKSVLVIKQRPKAAQDRAAPSSPGNMGQHP